MEISTSSRALNQNKIVNLKIAGRFRQVPLWATKLSFEVRPNDRFDNRAWKLWKPTLLLMNHVVKKRESKIVLAKKPPKYSDQKSIWWHRKP